MVAEALAISLATIAAGELHSSGWVQALGWAGQALFSARVLIQWLASERARRPVAPRIFWYLSAAGAVLMCAYCMMRGEIVLVPGYLVTLGVYVRNVWIANQSSAATRAPPLYLVLVGIALAVVPSAFGLLDDHDRVPPTMPWLVVAIIGQTLWIGRFLVQWRHAERTGKSEFPAAFWWMTIAGSGLLTAYSMNRVDLPLIFGFVMSWVFPLRNLFLHHRHQNAST